VKKTRLLYYEILNYQGSVLKLMRDNFEVITLPDPDHDTDEVLHAIEVTMAPLGFQFDRMKIDRCPSLKIIASSTISVPHIDVEYAVSKGIKIVSLSGQKEFLETITSTAELTWGLLIALVRRIPSAHKAVCAYQWNGRQFGHRTPHMLSQMILGIVGLGRLGSIVASYGRSFGMKVYYYSPSSRDPSYKQCSTLSELAQCSDIVSVHAHHTSATEKIIDKTFIQAMKPGSFIVNTARGALIDESALLEGLESGHLGGAVLDVLADEYQSDFKVRLNESPLIKYARVHDNLIITPHYAGATVDAWIKTQTRTIQLVCETLNGKQ
jgi:D-3-phosphoglycerate dehydrogenase